MKLWSLQNVFKKIGSLSNCSYGHCFYLFFFTTFAVISAFYLFYQTHNTERSTNAINGRSTLMLSTLHGLQGQLQQIENNSGNPSHIQNTLSSLVSELKAIEKSTADNAKAADIQKISDQLLTLKDDLADLEKNIAHQSNAKEYLNPKALPFQVSHLDMISGQPFISVNDDEYITPLILGSSLKGWMFAAADYPTQTVEFANAQGQHIKVMLGG